MNKRLSLLTAALLLTGASSAFAASSTDLTVTGFITPAACTPNLSGGGTVYHGKIPLKDLNQDSTTFLPAETLQLSISCNTSAFFALRGIDNRADSSTDASGYGIGRIKGVQKIGSYVLELENPMADGVAVRALESFDDGENWTDLSGVYWQHGNLAGFGDRSSGDWSPVAITELITDLVVKTGIAPASGLDLSDEVEIDGSATLEVKYL